MAVDRLMRRVVSPTANQSPSAAKDLSPAPVGFLSGTAWRPLLAVVGAVCLVLALAAVYGRARGIPLGDFTRDPLAVLHGPAYVGALSGLGVLIAWGSAVACAAAGLLLRRAGEAAAGAALLATGALTGLLAIDDLFALHEEAADRTGLPEAAVFAPYLVAGVALGWIFRDFVRASDWPVGAVAVGFVAASLVVDQADGFGGREHFFAEDSLKLLGITVWALFLTRESFTRLDGLVRKRSAVPSRPPR